MIKKYLSLILVLCGFTLGGCASNANFTQMIAHPASNQKPINKTLEHGIGVEQVSGGHETNPLWTSQINNAGFQTALVQSLKEANLYQELDDAKYILNVNLVKLHQPLVGFNFTVTCEVNYLLQDAQSKATLYSKNVVSSYTAKISDHPMAVTRLKVANEGAARENIRQFINDLYQLPKFKR